MKNIGRIALCFSLVVVSAQAWAEDYNYYYDDPDSPSVTSGISFLSDPLVPAPPAPPREYRIATPQDYELCSVDATKAWHAERLKTPGWNPETDTIEGRKRELEGRIYVMCGPSVSDDDKDLATYSELLASQAYEKWKKDQKEATAKKRPIVTTSLAEGGYVYNPQAGGESIALGAGVEVHKKPLSQFILNAKDGFKIHGRVITNPLRGNDKVSFLEVKVSRANEKKIIDSYTLEYDAGLDRWYVSRMLGMRGDKVLVSTDGESSVTLPWVGKVELGLGQSRGKTTPFFQFRGGLDYDECAYIKKSKHAVCGKAAAELIGGVLQAGFESVLGVQYGYRLDKDEVDGSDTVIKVGPRFDLDVLYDRAGLRDNSQLFFGVSLEKRN